MLDRFMLDAVELVMNETYCDSLDDTALSAMVVSTAEYLAHISQE